MVLPARTGQRARAAWEQLAYLCYPDGAEGAELVLEPNNFAPARASQKTLYDAGFPAAVFTTNDITAEYQRLKRLGVVFRGEPRSMSSHNGVFRGRLRKSHCSKSTGYESSWCG
jgi:hypothetical protein